MRPSEQGITSVHILVSRVPSKESQAGLLLRGDLNAAYRLY